VQGAGVTAVREWRIRIPVEVWALSELLPCGYESRSEALVVQVFSENATDAVTHVTKKLGALLAADLVESTPQTSVDRMPNDRKMDEAYAATPLVVLADLVAARKECADTRAALSRARGLYVDLADMLGCSVGRTAPLVHQEVLDVATTIRDRALRTVEAESEVAQLRQAREAETIRADALEARLEAARKLAGQVLGEGYVIGKPAAVVGVGAANGFGAVFTGKSGGSGMGPTGGEP
jgi:hypothetical protein